MRALSLFSGIGGIDLAAEWAGIQTVAFCEYADFPRKVLKKHWPDVPIFKDIKDLTKNVLEKEGVIDRCRTIELIHGGFPCQPYSTAGKRLGKKDDRDLWPEMFRLIRELQPRWVVGENVANFVNMELERTLIDLESEGYETQTFIVPAAAVDAKHQRSRTIIVAYSNRMWESQSQRCIKDLWGWISDSGEAMANAESIGSWGLSFREKTEKSRSQLDGENVAHTDSKRWRQMEQHDSRRETREKTVCSLGKCCLKFGGETSRWKPEPRVGRVANGIPNRVDRLKGLGNAVVPQQILPFFLVIMEIEKIMQEVVAESE